jgi:hypothetical protein
MPQRRINETKAVGQTAAQSKELQASEQGAPEMQPGAPWRDHAEDQRSWSPMSICDNSSIGAFAQEEWSLHALAGLLFFHLYSIWALQLTPLTNATVGWIFLPQLLSQYLWKCFQDTPTGVLMSLFPLSQSSSPSRFKPGFKIISP